MSAVVPEKLEWIEASRGIAALAVLLYHTARHFGKNYGASTLENVFQFGHAGVDLFFVISGFIILFVHFDDIGRPDRISRYLQRRLTRLLPPYWVAVTLTIVLTWLGGHAVSAGGLAKAIVPMPISTEPLLGVAWTLQYEFVFYTAFAVLILNRAVGVALMAVWLLGIVGAAIWGGRVGLPPAYWGVFNFEFFAGMAAAYRLRQGGLHRYKSVLWTGIGLFAAAALAEDLGWIDGYALSARLIYGLSGTMILLGAVEASRRGHARVPGFLKALGSASYSLYLFHFIFIGLAWKLWLATGSGALVSPLAGAAIFATIAIAGGILMSRLVEYPLMRFTRRVLAARRPAVAGFKPGMPLP